VFFKFVAALFGYILFAILFDDDDDDIAVCR
jgi:hypothetical protein